MRRLLLSSISLVLLYCAFAMASAQGAIELKTSFQDAFPKYYRNLSSSEQEIVGLCIDIIRAIENRDEEIMFRRAQGFVPLQRIKGQLSTGEIDVFVGLAKTEEREALYQYLPTPLYKINYVVAIRRNDDVNVRSYKELIELGNQSGGILVLRGSKSEEILKEMAGGYHVAIQREGKMINNLRKLIAGRGRFIFYHDLGLKAQIKISGLEEKVKILPFSFYEYEHYVAFSKDTRKEIVSRVGRILEKMAESGTLEKLYSKYVNHY